MERVCVGATKFPMGSQTNLRQVAGFQYRYFVSMSSHQLSDLVLVFFKLNLNLSCIFLRSPGFVFVQSLDGILRRQLDSMMHAQSQASSCTRSWLQQQENLSLSKRLHCNLMLALARTFPAIQNSLYARAFVPMRIIKAQCQPEEFTCSFQKCVPWPVSVAQLSAAEYAWRAWFLEPATPSNARWT